MDIPGVLTAPIRVGRLAVRALDDLNAVAERARREPDPVEQARERLDAMLLEMTALVGLVAEAIGEVRELNATGRSLDARARRIAGEASALTGSAERLRAVSEGILVEGRGLVETGQSVDRHSLELAARGGDIAAVADRVEESLSVFRAALPRLLEGIDTAEQLEQAVETVAETVEPLQGAAERVGRVTRRVGRGRR